MVRVGVWTRPTVVFWKPPPRELNAVMARVPLIPTSQSASERQTAAFPNGDISSSPRRLSKPSRIALAVMDWSQRRLEGSLHLAYWVIYLKISSPSRPASHALIKALTSLRFMSFISSLRRGSDLLCGRRSNCLGITGKLVRDHFPRAGSTPSGRHNSSRCPSAEQIRNSSFSK